MSGRVPFPGLLARLDRLFRRWDVALLYETEHGIKCLNQIIRSEHFDLSASETSFQLSPTEILLGVDGLKDEHTLLGTRISESPHLDLVTCFEKGGDIRRCSYVRKAEEGTLDFRPRHKVTDEHVQTLRRQFGEQRGAIEQEKYEPVRTVRIFDRHYIADGKHRAATCALLDVPIKCVDASGLIHDSFFWWVQRKMLRNKAHYRKHIELFESILEHYGRRKQS